MTNLKDDELIAALTHLQTSTKSLVDNLTFTIHSSQGINATVTALLQALQPKPTLLKRIKERMTKPKDWAH